MKPEEYVGDEYMHVRWREERLIGREGEGEFKGDGISGRAIGGLGDIEKVALPCQEGIRGRRSASDEREGATWCIAGHRSAIDMMPRRKIAPFEDLPTTHLVGPRHTSASSWTTAEMARGNNRGVV